MMSPLNARWRRRALALIGAAGVIVASGCGAEDADTATVSDERPVVAVTTNILADVVRELGGSDIDVVDVMPRGADPHSFGLSAREAETVHNADLIVTNGLGLEAGLTAITSSASADGVALLDVGAHVLPEAGSADVDSIDPHIWTDPTMMVTASELIGDALSEIVDPDAMSAMEARTDAYVARLNDLDSEIRDMVDELPADRRRLVTNHHVFGYFADRYDFEVIGAVIPSATTLASPSASDLDDLATQLRDADVPAIFADTSASTRLADALANEVGLDVEVIKLDTETLGAEGTATDTYLGMMQHNTSVIVDALR